MCNVEIVANQLMRAVVAAGVIRKGVEADLCLAVAVLREEMKAFLFGPKYAAEREMGARVGGERVAFHALVAECIARISKERIA